MKRDRKKKKEEEEKNFTQKIGCCYFPVILLNGLSENIIYHNKFTFTTLYNI